MTRTVGGRREDGRMLRDVAKGIAEAIRTDPAIAADAQVMFGDALVRMYIGENSHHRAYRPQGVDYSLYAVPEGYGYGTECAAL